MPDGLLDVGLHHPHPVVVGVDGSPDCVLAAQEAAQEAGMRGAALDLVTVVRPDLPRPRRTGRATVLPAEQLAEAVARQHPHLTVAAHLLDGDPAGVLVELSGRAGLLVLGARGAGRRLAWSAGSVAREVVSAAACPVLLVGSGSGFSGSTRRTVVVHAEGHPRAALPVVDVALAAAVRRGADLLVLRPYRRRAHEDAATSLDRARTGTAEMLRTLGVGTRRGGPAVTTVHTREHGAEVLARHARSAELVVVDAVTAMAFAGLLDRLSGSGGGSVLVVPQAAAGRREGCLAAYRQALADELSRTPRRRDGCATPEQLDDAWRVGVASPAVSETVSDAWRACLSAAGAVSGVASGRGPAPQERRPSWS